MLGDLLLVLGAALGGAVLLFWLAGFRYIPNDRVGVVEKRWSARGSLKGGFIALAGEAGFQPYVLRGGVHWRMPLEYVVHKMPLVTIPQGTIGYVFARDGAPLAATQTLASNVRADDFQDVATFLTRGGQRGPQRKILREGTYALNLAQFVVITRDGVHYLPMGKDEDGLIRRMAQLIAERHGFEAVVIKGSDDFVGIVTTHDGPSLMQGRSSRTSSATIPA